MDNFNENEKNEFENDVDNTENDNGKKTNKKWRKFKIPKEKINFKFSNYFVYIIVIAILLVFILFVTQNAKYIPIVLVAVLVATIIALLVSGKLKFYKAEALKITVVSTFGIIDDYVLKRQMIAEGLSIDNFEEDNNKSSGILSKIFRKRKPKKGIFSKYIFMFPFREILEEYSLKEQMSDPDVFKAVTESGIIGINTAMMYRIIDPKKRYKLGNDFDKKIKKSIQYCINNVIGEKDMQEVLASKNRGKLGSELKQYYIENIKPANWGLYVSEFLIDGIDLTPENQRELEKIQSAKNQRDRELYIADTEVQVARKKAEAMEALAVGKANAVKKQIEALKDVEMSEAAKLNFAKEIYSEISENATLIATMPNFDGVSSSPTTNSDYMNTAVKANIFAQAFNKEASSPKADETSTN